MSEEMYDPDEDGPMGTNLGRCCQCQGTDNVRNIIMLDFEAPEKGKGWGCVQCGIPADGAMMVLCDGCAEDHGENCQWVCAGYPTEGKRERITPEMRAKHFGHDMSKHPEVSNV